MSVRVQLDQPHTHFTNLDFITGRIILNLASDESIAQIVVKLEGESKTRLAAPKPEDGGRKRIELEVHKLLYRTQVVFPSEEILRQKKSTNSFTLRPGQHEYPFKFKIPINNNCSPNNSVYTNLNFSGPRVELAKDTEKHVKKTLPPSLSGFPNEAEIRYYVKVTVQRPQFYKENHRNHIDFKFFPIEPPRPAATRQEAYARRPAQFTGGLSHYPKKKTLFDAFRKDPSTIPQGPPPRFQIDARLPHPAIITCNEAIPLRILVKKLSECKEITFLSMLQIELIGYTHIRAHDVSRTESTSWIVITKSNLAVPIGDAKDPVETETPLDRRLWDNIPIPNTVAPSFETCNISRTYELEVRVGLSYGTPGNVKPQLLVLPFRIPVQVYSGIAPPPALLEAMAKNQNVDSLAAPPASFHFSSSASSSNVPAIPTTPLTPSYTEQLAQVGEHIDPNSYQGTFGDAAPPSYEDAMADEIGPVDGPRRDYRPPPTTATSWGIGASSTGDSKTDSISGGPGRPIS